MVGVKRIVTDTEPPGGTVPLVGLAAYPAVPVPPTALMPVKVRMPFPLLPIVNIRVGDSPKFTFPNAMSPVTLIIRVALADDGPVGEDDDDPHAASRRETTTSASLFVISVPFRSRQTAAHEPLSLTREPDRCL